MKIKQNKSKISTIALILLLTISAMIVALPAATAHDPPLEITSYAYMIAVPNPIGVGQNTYITMWVDTPLPDAAVDNDIRRHGYKLTITKPDGTIALTMEWPIVSDTTGLAFTSFTPDQVGTYTFKFDYAGQVYTWDDTSSMRTWTNDTFLPATRTTTLTVQEEPLPDLIRSYPLPTEYWTRPIEGQNLDWWTISSHWLRGSYFGAFQTPGGRLNLWQRDGVAPNSAHILWTKPIEFGGVVGGSNVRVEGSTYYSGGSYEGRFGDAIIMHGRLYFTLPLGHSGGGGGYICIDLRTGEEIWYREDLGTGIAGGYSSSKGQLYDFDSPNQHGVGGGILWQTMRADTWSAFDGFTGKWLYNITGVPSGTEVYTDKGEIVRYQLNYAGRWLALWNWTEAPDTRAGVGGRDPDMWRPNGKTIDTSTAYSWNVTIPDLPGSSSPSIVAILPGDIILGRSFSVTTGTYKMANRLMADPYTVWAISDKPESRGQLLWIKNYAAPAGNIGRVFGPVDPVNRVWTMTDAETMQWLGYSLDDGSLLWGPTGAETRDIQFFASGSGAGQRAVTAYGNIYVQGYGGEIFAYSTNDGTLLWKYNNTDSGLQTPWGLMPTLIAAVADGKVYVFNNEHSPNSPLYRGYKVYTIDAFTGEEIWTLPGWAGTIGGHGVSTSVLAEGILAYYNFYDNQIYAVGKGPSATTVTASPKVSVHGDSVLVEGTVIDTAAGTKQKEQAARFPNGVPAVSDESMGDWMEYVYLQKPRPADTTGVQVKLEAYDPNGNYQNLGTATSDSYGRFGFVFEPEVPGTYWISAKFEGSESYYGSVSTTYLHVDPAPTPATQIEPEEPETPTEPEEPEEPETPEEPEEPEEPETPEEPTAEAPFITTEVAIIEQSP